MAIARCIVSRSAGTPWSAMGSRRYSTLRPSGVSNGSSASYDGSSRGSVRSTKQVTPACRNRRRRSIASARDWDPGYSPTSSRPGTSQ